MKVCGYTGKAYQDTFTCAKCIAVDPSKCPFELHEVTHYTYKDAKEVISEREIDTVILMQEYLNMRELYNVTRSLVLKGKRSLWTADSR